jgi:prolipoprotein diacylglyceryltransferase
VEFVRRNEDVFLGLTQPQLLSVVMMAGGAIWLWVRRPAPAPAAVRA